jgi:hypothetical protein
VPKGHISDTFCRLQGAQGCSKVLFQTPSKAPECPRMVYVCMAALQTPSPAPGYLVYWSFYPAEIIGEQELNDIFSKRSLIVFWSQKIKGEQKLNKIFSKLSLLVLWSPEIKRDYKLNEIFSKLSLLVLWSSAIIVEQELNKNFSKLSLLVLWSPEIIG